MKNEASFITDAAEIITENLDTYDAEAWAIIAVYEKVHGVNIRPELIHDIKERAQKLADAFDRIESQL